MKILLIGGAGFIGSHTALRLLREGHEPVVLDSLDPQIHGADLGTSATFGLLNGRVPVICGDTRDHGAVEKAVRDVEAIYYFPAGTGTGQSMYQIERYTDINAGARRCLARCSVSTRLTSARLSSAPPAPFMGKALRSARSMGGFTRTPAN